MADIQPSTLLGILSITFTCIIGVYITFINFISKRRGNGVANMVTRREFEEHKKNVQYKDNCEVHVDAIKNGMADTRKLFDTKLTAIEGKLSILVTQVCNLVKANGGKNRTT